MDATQRRRTRTLHHSGWDRAQAYVAKIPRTVGAFGDSQTVTVANVTAFRFALIEIDCVPVELQLVLLSKLKLRAEAILARMAQQVEADHDG